MEILLKYDADINYKNNDNATPIIIAMREKVPEALEILLRNNADVSCKDRNGNTPLMIGIKENSFEEVKLLLMHLEKQKGECTEAHEQEHKVEKVLDIKNCKEETALMLAAEKGDLRSLQLLLQLGAGTDLQDVQGRTALHKATAENEVQCVKQLLACGARKDVEDNKGETALDIARCFWFRKCSQLLGEGEAEAEASEEIMHAQEGGLFAGLQFEYQLDKFLNKASKLIVDDETLMGIGVELGLPPEDIQAIRTDNRDSIRAAAFHLLLTWKGRAFKKLIHNDLAPAFTSCQLESPFSKIDKPKFCNHEDIEY